MADPISIGTMAAISMGTSAAGGVLGAFGAASKDDAASAMYTYKAGVAAANTKVAAQNADYAVQLGGARAEAEGIKGRQILGTQKVDQAAGNIDPTSGTAAKVRDSQLAGLQETEGSIRNDAARKAYGYQVEGMNFTAEGELDTSAASNIQTQKGFDIASSLLGGATSVSDKWLKFKTAGVFS